MQAESEGGKARGPAEAASAVRQALTQVAAKVQTGGRITSDEARLLWQHASDDELKALAGAVRSRYHVLNRATYMIMPSA